MQTFSNAYKVVRMSKRRQLTPKEKACAERANKLWQKKKRDENLSQQKAADRIGMTASGFNQYINGIIPLNTDATAALAKFFEVNPREIDPDWLKNSREGAPAEEHLDAVFEDIISRTYPGQDMSALHAIADRVSPKDAFLIAKVFLSRAEAGLSKQK